MYPFCLNRKNYQNSFSSLFDHSAVWCTSKRVNRFVHRNCLTLEADVQADIV